MPNVVQILTEKEPTQNKTNLSVCLWGVQDTVQYFSAGFDQETPLTCVLCHNYLNPPRILHYHMVLRPKGTSHNQSFRLPPHDKLIGVVFPIQPFCMLTTTLRPHRMTHVLLQCLSYNLSSQTVHKKIQLCCHQQFRCALQISKIKTDNCDKRSISETREERFISETRELFQKPGRFCPLNHDSRDQIGMPHGMFVARAVGARQDGSPRSASHFNMDWVLVQPLLAFPISPWRLLYLPWRLVYTSYGDLSSHEDIDLVVTPDEAFWPPPEPMRILTTPKDRPPPRWGFACHQSLLIFCPRSQANCAEDTSLDLLTSHLHEQSSFWKQNIGQTPLVFCSQNVLKWSDWRSQKSSQSTAWALSLTLWEYKAAPFVSYSLVFLPFSTKIKDFHLFNQETVSPTQSAGFCAQRCEIFPRQLGSMFRCRMRKELGVRLGWTGSKNTLRNSSIGKEIHEGQTTSIHKISGSKFFSHPPQEKKIQSEKYPEWKGNFILAGFTPHLENLEKQVQTWKTWKTWNNRDFFLAKTWKNIAKPGKRNWPHPRKAEEPQ